VLCEVLAKYPAIELDAVILCGSIVDCSFDWRGLIEAGRVHRVRNETSGDDAVVCMFRTGLRRVFVPRSGASGVDGFLQTCGSLEREHFPRYTHSSAHVSSLHCLTYWLPFIRETRPFRDICRACLDVHHPQPEQPIAQFENAYGPAIERAVAIAWAGAPALVAEAYVKVLRLFIIRDGAVGNRTFAELLERYVRVLRGDYV
jgi:hypothetical protein